MSFLRRAAPRCKLCRGSGENRTGRVMRVNNHICPRCGGYGTVPRGCANGKHIDQDDLGYMRNNGLINPIPHPFDDIA